MDIPPGNGLGQRLPVLSCPLFAGQAQHSKREIVSNPSERGGVPCEPRVLALDSPVTDPSQRKVKVILRNAHERRQAVESAHMDDPVRSMR